MDDTLTARAGWRDALPTVFGYIGISMAFGIVAKAAGLSTWLIVLISAIDYGGSAQFVLVTMVGSHSSIVAIAFAVFLVNARMILMSMTLAPYFNRYSLWRNIWLGTFVTDESFALGMSKVNVSQNRLSFPWFNTVNLVSYASWLLGTFLGAVVGGLVTDPSKFGLDFAITAMFIGLLIAQISSDKTIKLALQVAVVIFVLVLIYLFLIFVPKSFVVLLVTICGSLFGMVMKRVFD
ncbi:AzlC family ABC transporter permease [Fructobacillus tropaeoli]|uniref:AzlC family ABC transporter permease n=1 Tax=Fructobacillus tropaeoli TaxID=709323 RepID=UPI001940F7AA|nr:AzlC family ABC transporter permease [Fructobacillus tropaeoli]GIC70326.1 AzlC family ABC transporter permease [Fructobacillus tropaeoli]